jgi:hypothetical protein
MATSAYIPAGRTSLVKRGDLVLQVQTEYAQRPSPRITTTILSKGQVLHKVELALERPIDSLRQLEKADTIIKRQHSEVLSIVNNQDSNLPLTGALVEQKPVRPPTTYERLAELPGVDRVYRLDTEGHFLDGELSEEFTSAMRNVFTNIADLIQIFIREPGVGMTREKGVCEIEHNKLYIASAGAECYFILLGDVPPGYNYEKVIKDIVDPPPEIKPYRPPS